MKVLRKITHDGQDLFVVADERGLFIERREDIKFYAVELFKTFIKLTNEEILNINKKLLKEDSPSMYRQVYGEE